MSTDTCNHPRVGVATLVLKDSKILLGRDTRKGDVWAVPGGHWENRETISACAKRETLEESGVTCDNVVNIGVFDFYREDKQRSYVTIQMKADYVSGELTEKQDEGRLEWQWVDPSEALKLHLFPADKNMIEKYLAAI